jgi:hypothetical protein
MVVMEYMGYDMVIFFLTINGKLMDSYNGYFFSIDIEYISDILR